MAGIKDKVTVIGMGCTKFDERWKDSREDLILEAVNEALDDAGLTIDDIDAFSDKSMAGPICVLVVLLFCCRILITYYRDR